ncbi:succinate dehydrogenase hydrophobic membrane anchor subunit [Micrococcales bacterium 31B]|nr:succinate dehydrogenase hydrophobic membrane anchor subunit [Micrococcales bacterium 31B]
MSVAIDKPRSRYERSNNTKGNFEMVSWVFMRASGVLLVVLIFGHLFVNLMLGDGVQQIDFAFVGGKWSSPFWQVWDLLMLWLGMLHGTNGVRTIISDYAEKPTTRIVLKSMLYAAAIIVIVLGSLVIFSFDPCPPSADPSLLPGFCTA